MKWRDRALYVKTCSIVSGGGLTKIGALANMAHTDHWACEVSVSHLSDHGAFSASAKAQSRWMQHGHVQAWYTETDKSTNARKRRVHVRARIWSAHVRACLYPITKRHVRHGEQGSGCQPRHLAIVRCRLVVMVINLKPACVCGFSSLITCLIPSKLFSRCFVLSLFLLTIYGNLLFQLT
jgi:hypothetical protein